MRSHCRAILFALEPDGGDQIAPFLVFAANEFGKVLWRGRRRFSAETADLIDRRGVLQRLDESRIQRA